MLAPSLSNFNVFFPSLLIAQMSFLLILFIIASANSSQLQNTSKKVDFNTQKVIILEGNSTILSQNGTFQLGFFNTNKGSTHYLGIWYALIPIPTYVWVANREKPIKNLTSTTPEIVSPGKLTIIEDAKTVLWETESTDSEMRLVDLKLLDYGNLVLFSQDGEIAWQSFDFPTDTYLPGMNVTRIRMLTSLEKCFRPFSRILCFEVESFELWGIRYDL